MVLTVGGGSSSGRHPPPLLLAASAIGAVLVLVPLTVTVSTALQVPPALMLGLLLRPLVAELLTNTLVLMICATAVTAVIGVACSWFVERTRLPGRRAWAVLAAIPLAVPPFVSSYAWVSLSPALQDFAGALLVVSCAYYPLIYLPVAATLRGMDPILEDTARSLGVGGWGILFRVVLPQLRPALFGGMLLVALHMLTEFGAFSLLRFRTFTTELFVEYRTGFNGPEASLLAVVLLLLCLLCLLAELKAQGAVRYVRVGRGARRPISRHNLARARIPVLCGFGMLTTVTIAVPLGMILYWLTQHSSAATAPAAASMARLFAATLSSLGLGLAGGVLAVALALPLGFLTIRYQGRFVTALERTVFVSQGVPGIVVALALIAFTIHTMQPLYQSVLLLLIAYVILFLPLALVGVRAALVQVPPSLEETARSLGLNWIGVTRRILVPLARPGLGAAAALVFVSIATELTATLLLAPIGTQTLATQVWANGHDLAFAAAAPYAAMMMAVSLLSTWLLARRFGSNAFIAV